VAVDGPDPRIDAGKVIVLLVGSGAGKSTFARVLFEPDDLAPAGFEVVAAELAIDRDQLGLMPQRGALLDVRGNLELARRHAGRGPERANDGRAIRTRTARAGRARSAPRARAGAAERAGRRRSRAIVRARRGPGARVVALVPCYGDLVAALRGRAVEFHRALTAGFARLLSDIFVGRITASGVAAGLVIRRATPGLVSTVERATAPLELDGSVAATP